MRQEEGVLEPDKVAITTADEQKNCEIKQRIKKTQKEGEEKQYAIRAVSAQIPKNESPSCYVNNWN